MFKKVLFASLISCLFSVSCFASEQVLSSKHSYENPQDLVKDVANDTLNYIKSDKDLKNGSTKKFIEWVNANAIIYFDFNKISSLALGKDWKLANSEQKQIISSEFKTLLTRTFANAFTGITVNQTMEFKNTTFDANATEVIVKSLIIKPSSKPIDINYSLYKGDEGWKIYDISVSGVSLVTNYRSSFSEEIRANGIDGLIAVLKEKNSKLINKS